MCDLQAVQETVGDVFTEIIALQQQRRLRNKTALMSESASLLLFTGILTDNKISENPIGSTLPRFNTNQIVTSTSSAFAQIDGSLLPLIYGDFVNLNVKYS
jgi:hypothetical protein